MNQEKKLTGHESWIRFRNRVIAGLGIFALITLYASFYFVGPIRGKVVDAKTGEPIAGIRIGYYISGDEICPPLANSCGWGKGVEAYTDNNGKFKIPLSIAWKIPFFQWLDSKRRISASEKYDPAVNNNYDDYKEEFVWFPFKSFKFALVPTPETLDDCRDNLTEDEQYRCVKMLAERDEDKIYGKYYLMTKYQHILNGYCNNSLRADTSECITVIAVNQQDKHKCLSLKNYKYGYGEWDRCIYYVAIELNDKLWCEELPSENVKDYPVHYNITREKCEKTIDTLTAEKK